MQSSLIGRDKERSTAAEALRRALSSQATPLLITGDAGYGKSSMVDHIVREAVARGFASLVVRADEADGGVPYAALYTALTAGSPLDDDERRRELVTLLERGMLGRGADDDVARSRVVELLRRVLVDLAFRQPVIVAFDDLHAADPGSVAAVLFLMRHLRRERILLVVTSRCGTHDLDPATAAALARFHADGSIELLELGAFDHDDVAAVVAERFGAAPDASLVETLEERTGGNPFFVVELVDALASTSAVSVEHGRVRVSADSFPTMPHSVSTAVLHRVFQLGPTARLVASAASVIGNLEVRALPLLAQLCCLDDARAEEAFDTLVRSRVLVETGAGFRFAHPIVRDALYHDIGPGERSRIHWSIARYLAAERARGAATSVVDIAAHARHAHPEASTASAELFVEAGDALLHDEPKAAVEWFDDALAASPVNGIGRPAILIKRCHALDLSGRHAEAANAVLEIVDVVPVGPQRHDAVLVAARALTASDRLDEADALLDSALDEPSLHTPRLLLESGFVALWRQHLDKAARRLHAAETIGAGDDCALVDLLRTHLDLDRGRHREGFERASMLEGRLSGLTPLLRRSTALGLVASAAIHGDPRAVLGGRATIGDVDLTAVPALSEWHHTFRAWASYRTGQWDDAIASAERALATEDDPSAHAAALAADAVRTAVRAERGEPAATPRAASAAASATSPMFGYLATWAAALDAKLGGRPADAVEMLRPIYEPPHAPGSPSARSVVLALAAEAAWAAGDETLARRINDELQALPHDSTGVAMTLRCLLAQALIESDDAAAERARSIAVEHALAFEAACALAQLGAIRRDADTLAAAHDELGRIGAVVRQRGVTHELRKLGRRAPRQRRGGMLTAVEVEIAELVAEGLSNRQIAERALLSPKTIEVYLSRIYAKVRCRSRVELAVLVNSGRLARLVDGDAGTVVALDSLDLAAP